MAKELSFVPKTLISTKENEVRTDSALYNTATRNHQMVHEEVNTAYNHHVIIDKFEKGIARDIGDEPKAPKNEKGESMPAIIIGSGPSFDINIEYLKEWKGGIFCSTSHARTLMYHGIEPTHLVCLDPFSMWSEIDGIDWSKTRTKLIAHPGVWPDVIEKWPNDMMMYIENIGRPDSFYATTQKHMYSKREELGPQRQAAFNYYIKTEITLFAASPPIQVFTASTLGYGTLFFMGVDLGFHSGFQRFTDYTIDSNGEWTGHPHPFDESFDRPLIRCKNGVYTESIHLYYKKNILSAWILGGATIYTTDKGIITEMPYVNMKLLAKSQGYGYTKQTQEFINEHAEPYLASVGAFVLRSPSGSNFIECPNPFADLPAYMQTMNKRYICDKCNATMTANTDEDGSGKPCPICVNQLHDNKPGTLRREINIDIEENMKRISKYINKNG